MAIPSTVKGYGNGSTARNVFRLTFSTALSAAPKYEAYDGGTFPALNTGNGISSTVLAGTSGNGNKSMVCLIDTSSGAPTSNWKPASASGGSLNPNRLKGTTSYVTATSTPGAGGTITWNEVLEVPSDTSISASLSFDLLVRYSYTGTAPTLTWAFNDDASGGGTEASPVWTTITPGTHGVQHTRAGTTFAPFLGNIPASGTEDTAMGWVTEGGVVFFDDFGGSSLASSLWSTIVRHGDYGNSELQCYRASQVSVASGNLTITADHSTGAYTCGDTNHSTSAWDYVSAMIQTKFTFTYGTIKIRAKLPTGAGPWPAVWLLGTNCQSTNINTADNGGGCSWPNPGSDEIDLIEFGQNFGGSGTVGQGYHSTGDNWQAINTGLNLTSGFHDYEIVWTAGSLIYKVDGTTTRTISSVGVPSTPMFLVCNMAVGGNGGGSPTVVDFPTTFQVDYIQIRQ